MTPLQERWRSLCDKVGIASEHQQELIERYGERQRAYHTLQHIGECLDWFDALKDAASDALVLELAIWYHDVVYDPRLSGNEEASANFSRIHLRGCILGHDKVEEVAALILWTTHAELPPPGDATLIVDIDLAILGAPADRFEEYETQVRQEYSWVPGFVYRKKRASVLRSFLERPRIYGTPRLHEALEARARANLLESLRRLEG